MGPRQSVCYIPLEMLRVRVCSSASPPVALSRESALYSMLREVDDSQYISLLIVLHIGVHVCSSTSRETSCRAMNEASKER